MPDFIGYSSILYFTKLYFFGVHQNRCATLTFPFRRADQDVSLQLRCTHIGGLNEGF